MRKSTVNKINNWIYYYKWYVVTGVLLLLFLVRYAAGLLGLAGSRPDLQAAYVGRHVLSAATISQLESLLAGQTGDYNRDGKVLVKIHTYLTSDESGAAEAQQNASASEISLAGDIDGCESFLFLLEDPEQFQIEWQILADKDGNPPDVSDYSARDKVIPLTDLLPDLSGISDAEERSVLSSLLVGRRCFYDNKECENAKSLAAYWSRAAGSSVTVGADRSGATSGSVMAETDGTGAAGNSMTDKDDNGTGDAGSKGNAASLPDPDVDGNIRIGTELKAPLSFDKMTLNEYNEALAANGFYYATWTSGEPAPYTNDSGEDALLYPLQLYIVTYEGTDPDDASAKASGWLAAARKNYQITTESVFTTADGKYILLEYTFPDEAGPYACGISAFLTSDSDIAFCAELLSVRKEEGETSALRELLQAFLSSCDINT